MRRDTKLWWQQGQRDFLTAKNSHKAGDYYAAVYFSHQAVEKALKAVIAEGGREISSRTRNRDVTRQEEQRASVMTTIIAVIIIVSALLAFMSPGGPQPMVLLFGILVAAIIFMATRYAADLQRNLLQLARRAGVPQPHLGLLQELTTDHMARRASDRTGSPVADRYDSESSDRILTGTEAVLRWAEREMQKSSRPPAAY